MRRTTPHPPPGPAPEGEAPGRLLPVPKISRRRLDLAIALATLLAAGAIVGVGVARRGAERIEDPPAPSGATPTPTPAEAAEVERAYLAFREARAEAYLRLDPAALEGLATGDALEWSRRGIDDARTGGRPIRVRGEHHPQVVVYSTGDLASVDDIWVNHSVEVDPTTHEPTQPDPALLTHDSYTFRKVGGRWVAEDAARFGVAREAPPDQTKVSRAAASFRTPLSPERREEVERAYLTYRTAKAQALLTLDPAPLEGLLGQAVLALERSGLEELRGSGWAARTHTEHNYRIAREGEDVAWVYDTYLYRDVLLRMDGSGEERPGEFEVLRKSYTLRREGGRWLVENIVGYR